MRSNGKLVLAAAALALAAACSSKSATPAFRTEAVSRGEVSETVSATGDVSALTTVNVGSQVSGIIEKLYVDFNAPVTKGQLLATLDPRLFVAAQQKAEAGLASARANVQKAQAAAADSQRLALRDRDLKARGLISQAELDTAVSTRDGNAATLAGAKASVLQAQADRDQASINLAFTKITSPIDGVVISRSIDVGQTVAAAFQAPTLFVIANDLTKMQILANVDEADVGKVREGETAKFTVDAYPGESFSGTIRQVRQAATTTNNVVTYAAVIDADNPARKLRPGMTASVTIVAASKDGVLRVANAALRFTPPQQPGAPQGADAKSGGQQAPARARSGPATPRAVRSASAASAATMADTSGQAAATSGDAAATSAEQPAGVTRTVYKLENGKPIAVSVKVGLADASRTEIVSGLAENDQVIVGGNGGSPAAPAASPAAASKGGRRGPF